MGGEGAGDENTRPSTTRTLYDRREGVCRIEGDRGLPGVVQGAPFMQSGPTAIDVGCGRRRGRFGRSEARVIVIQRRVVVGVALSRSEIVAVFDTLDGNVVGRERERGW